MEMMSRPTPLPEILEFVHRLVTYDAAIDSSDSSEHASHGTGWPAEFRVADKLRYPLSRLAGATGFRLLLTRALTLAKARMAGVNQLQLNQILVKADGSLGGFDNNGGFNNNGDSAPSSEAAAVLMAELLALLVAFVGEAFTLSLVRDVWPGFPVLETELWRISNRDEPEKS
jgi:hypothetical protein